MPKFSVVMLSGNFDPFHDGHLDYFEQAIKWGGLRAWENRSLVCVVASDKQLLMKKGKVNIPEEGRLKIVELVLEGIGYSNIAYLNEWDTETTLVAKALRAIQPDVFFRGGDKTLETMPPEERQACEELDIKIEHAEFKVDRHGSKMEL